MTLSSLSAVFGEPMAWRYFVWMLEGFAVTLILSAAVCVTGSVCGALLCGMKLSGRSVFATSARIIISALRNTPLLVQLFFWYFGMSAFLPSPLMQWLNTPHILSLPFVSLRLPGFESIAAFFALTLYAGSYIAEELQAGINQVDKGQEETARALGFNKFQCLRLIILPQAVAFAWMPITGQYLNTIKNTSLTMAIGVAELSYASRQVETETFLTFQAFGIATVFYIVAVCLTEAAASRLHSKRRMRISLPETAGSGT
ncbi:amino acid ABC transporter permease [Rhizobium lemnae]|uniref:Amino acid ABC transporter permease n=1 Tax=Rhizobium lemnae TaxID=1214924 RepID=A0ABV8E884_9HYPH|nr:amino acid ABC transporter permease [Rhizobium lemnae]MCJ8507712.1 amino acid ABC transporter permease [Rhizobium lemnae]